MSRQQGDTDELFDIKNAYFIGNYQNCINEAQKFKTKSEEAKMERDVFLYRSYIAQKKYRVVLDEITSSSPSELQSLKMLAQYFSSPSSRAAILDKLEEELKGDIDINNHVHLIAAATIFYHESNYEAVFRLLMQSDHLECIALRLQTCLKINRPDNAMKELKLMQEKDDDATLTQLAQAWINMDEDDEKINEAYYIYQELSDKYGATPVLLNGQAVCHICTEKFEEAESVLQEALDKDPNNSDTLVNMMVLSYKMDKNTELSNRYLSQLKESFSDHPFVKDIIQKQDELNSLLEACAQLNVA